MEPKTQQLLREKAVENGGMEVIVLAPEQIKPFQDKVQGVRKELMEKYGEEACKAFNIH